jgi:hypothetical protein
MNSLARRVLLLLAALPLAVAAGGADDVVTAGRALYREGVLFDGAPLTGIGAAGVVRKGREAACIGCHRRSGFGIAEGPLVVRPITAPDLFGSRAAPAGSPRIEHQLGKRRRPVYDVATLANALRAGVDMQGHPLHPMMPRYELGERDMAKLLAYLRTLYAAPDPGADEQEIRLATVIQPGVDAGRRRAMVEVLQAFVRDKNAAVRSEPARRSAGGMRMHRAWRRWALDIWELHGAPESWSAQLEALYRKAPVFALVSGIGNESWQPVHDFSERFGVPCILPQTSLPGTGPNFYTLYFSRGMALEADALALDLRRLASGKRVLQLVREDDPESAAGARALAAALAESGVNLQQAPAGAPLPATQDIGALVLWLRRADPRLAVPPGLPTYLSGTMLDGAIPQGENVRITYPWRLPGDAANGARRATAWLRARGLDEGRVAADTWFAATLAGEALSHLMDSFSRDYLVETVEHELSTTVLASSYPSLTLGPDQRFASKGVYIATPAVLAGQAAAPALIVP